MVHLRLVYMLRFVGPMVVDGESYVYFDSQYGAKKMSVVLLNQANILKENVMFQPPYFQSKSIELLVEIRV